MIYIFIENLRWDSLQHFSCLEFPFFYLLMIFNLEIKNKLPINNPKSKIKAGLSSCCLFYNTTLLIWGRIVDSIHGERIERENNKFIKYTFENNIINVKFGESHILILTENKVYVLGEGLHGELGLGEITNSTTLNEIPFTIKINRIFPKLNQD